MVTLLKKGSTHLVQSAITDKKLYAIQGGVCPEISLTPQSSADVIISKEKSIQQKADDILLIIEVKMSVVWNWQYFPKKNKIITIGDYRTHTGNPGFLRSDSMLKEIGKSINIRVSNSRANTIPIIILGNTPITLSYREKVDQLKEKGIIQGFWSLNPSPKDNGESLKHTDNNGFYRFDSFNEFRESLRILLSDEMHFFSSMKRKKDLGRLIKIADKQGTYEGKANLFLKLLNQ